MKTTEDLLTEVDILEKEVKRLNGMVVGLQNIIMKPAMGFEEIKESVKKEKKEEIMFFLLNGLIYFLWLFFSGLLIMEMLK